jgi:hypothetical protein
MFSHSILRNSRILISLSLLMLVGTTVTVAAKGGWSEEEVSLKGNFTVSIAFIQNSSACGAGDNCIMCVNHDPPRFYIQAEGVGDTSRLGSLFLKIQKCADPTASSFGSYQGTFAMTAPNGKDSLTGIYTGKNTSGGDTYGFLPFSGELKITGGTGRFENAQGHARFTALAGPNGTAFYAVEGEVVSR